MAQENDGIESSDGKWTEEKAARQRLGEQITRLKTRTAALYEQSFRLHDKARSLNARARDLNLRAQNLGQQGNGVFETRDLSEMARVRAKAKRLGLQGDKETTEALLRVLLRDVLASVTDGKMHLCDLPGDLPPLLEYDCKPVLLTRTAGLGDLRDLVRQEALGLAFPDERWQDLVTAAQETGMNAVVHAGGGIGYVSTNGEDTVQVRIEDQGAGIEVERLPRAVLEKGYTTAETFGHGMKMMLLTADRVWLLTGISGTTVVLEQDRNTPSPSWL